MLNRIAYILMFLSCINVSANELQNDVENFLNEYIEFHNKPKVSNVSDYFATNTLITYYDSSPKENNTCKKGCKSDLLSFKRFLLLVEIGEKNYQEDRIERKIDFPKIQYKAIVTTKIIEKELTKKQKVISKIDVVEKLYIKKIKNKLFITKVDIFMDSSKKQIF